jgi:hypothetical protein
LTLVHPETGFPDPVQNGSGVEFGKDTDGFVLALAGGVPNWSASDSGGQIDPQIESRVAAVESAIEANSAQDESWRQTATTAFDAVSVQSDNNAELIGMILGNEAGDVPQPWVASSYQPGSVVTHLGGVWVATQLSPAGHVPGSSVRWEAIDIPSLADRVRNSSAPSTTPGLDGLLDVTVPPNTPVGKVLGTTAVGEWGPVDPQNGSSTLDSLTDVSAPSDTPADNLLGTKSVGQWEPVSVTSLKDQIVGPLQTEIGDPHVVAAHTNLVGYIGELESRVSSLEASAEPPVADVHLFVDNYGGGFIRVSAGSISTTTNVDLALATTPGPNGTVYPALSDIPGGNAVWADFNGTLGKVKTAQGADVLGAAVKEWIRKVSILTVHKDSTDSAHPALIVDSITNPTPAGSNLTLDDLSDVTAPDTTHVGSFLGVTSSGQWGPLSGLFSYLNTVPPYWTSGAKYLPGDVILASDGYLTVGVDNGYGSVEWKSVNGAFLAETSVFSDTVLHSIICGTSSNEITFWEAKNYTNGDVVLHPVANRGRTYYQAYMAMGNVVAASVPGAVPHNVWLPLSLPGLAESFMNFRVAPNLNTTPIGKLLGTTSAGTWGAVDPPTPTGVWKSWTGTQAEYDAITTKDDSTLYVVI